VPALRGGPALNCENFPLSSPLPPVAFGQRQGLFSFLVIEAKIAGRQWVLPAEEPPQVLQLLDALKQSVAAAEEQTGVVRAKPKKRPTLARRRSA
jgi:hypothetical protein